MRSVPEGHPENSPAFQRRDFGDPIRVPKGRLSISIGALLQPSLRDLSWRGRLPSVETLGYFQLSLRDSYLRITERHST